jgi:hypothetical protein
MEASSSESQERTATELNLTSGLAGALVDTIVQTRIRDDARNGMNLEAKQQKRVQSALDAISSKKRYTAGLHVAAGRYLMGPDVLTNVSDRKAEQEEKECQKVNKKINDFRALESKMSAIRDLGKTHDELNVSQLQTMVSWFKQAKDSPMPPTRQLLLTTLFAHQIERHLLSRRPSGAITLVSFEYRDHHCKRCSKC